MQVTRQALETLLLSNVVDLRFVRRRPQAGRPATRRMLCTKCYDLLNTTNGKVVLNYKAPKGTKQFNESANNSCVVWDILMQDYRIVSAESVNVIRVIPGTDEFWNFFNNEIYVMPADKKIEYMDT